MAAVTQGSDSLAFRFDLEGRSLRLVLSRSTPPTARGYRGLSWDGTGRLVRSGGETPACLYRGYVEDVTSAGERRISGSYAAVSTCIRTAGHAEDRTVSGILATDTGAWSVRPLASPPATPDAQRGVEHRFVPLSAARSESPLDAAVTTGVARELTASFPTSEFREGTPLETKYIEVLAVNDERRSQAIGSETEADTIARVAEANELLANSSLSPRLRLVLGGQVTFDSDPFTPAMASATEVDSDQLLSLFQSWLLDADDLPPFDGGVLMSGYDFPGNQAGLAPIDSMCGVEAAAIVEADTLGGSFTAITMVHELGHTVGMLHDGDNGCVDDGFIMAPVACANCGTTDDFSTCSATDFEAFLEGPYYVVGGNCLDDVPPQVGQDLCGDGIVSGGEECDCGALDCSGVDACCDGATCQLEAGAACSDFNDLCCDECQVIAAEAGVTCRPSQGSCDQAEVCNGVSKSCPGDVFEDAATSCEDDQGDDGWCFEGRCVSLAEQCAAATEIFEVDLEEPDSVCGATCGDLICQQMDGTCTILVDIPVLDGTGCGSGQCQSGECVEIPDQCPGDPNKNGPGVCGCGVPDDDADDDGEADCVDGCPMDAEKVAPGQCGCGEADTDSDDDGVADCDDECPNDPDKAAAGECGCGTPEADSDDDGTLDCNDECPGDAAKTSAGDCGCGEPETDSDDDGTSDCADECPEDPAKDVEGDCGCGQPETDSDDDGAPDCVDECPADAAKSMRGDCGCGQPDTHSDDDDTADCVDGCPSDGGKTEPGICGCGVADDDTDLDATPDCTDACPLDGTTTSEPCGAPTVVGPGGGGSASTAGSASANAGAAASGGGGAASDSTSASCSCRVAQQPTPTPMAWLGAALLGLAMRRRVRRA